MKKSFKLQKGVSLTQVCGESLLVATREAFGKCPYVNRISEFEKDYWILMTEEKNPGEILQYCVTKYKVNPSEMIRLLSYATEKFKNAGYFIEEPVEE